MSTATVDLSTLQQINFGNGVTGSYDPNSGTYYDSGGNPLSASALAQYGSFTVGSQGTTAPPAPSGSAAPTGAGNGASLSGLSGIFSSIGNSIVNATRSPSLTTPSGQTLVYNPATGTYQQPTPTGASALMPILLLGIAAIFVFYLMKEM